MSEGREEKVKIVSWMGGEHWYIGNVQFLRLEEAIAFCERNSLDYEVVKDPNYMHRHEGG
jgi:hypothetical protein